MGWGRASSAGRKEWGVTGRSSGGGDDLEGFGEAAVGQAARPGAGGEPTAQPVLEVVHVGGLADVGLERGELAIEDVGDVDAVVRHRPARDPHLAGGPRLEPLVAYQFGKGIRVARVGI